MPFVKINGIDTYYSVIGTGSPIVLIHHLAGNMQDNCKLLEYL